RVHRTGDRVRRRPDGRLEFVGRREDLVELRGHRVELGEVAAGLEALPGVRASAAAVVTGPAGAPRLVGYVVGDRDGRLLDRLRERVPGYLVPGELVWLDRLPRTATGKVDRAALPHVGRGGLPGPRRRSGAGPVDEVERVVAETWREVLGVRVRRTDDFFALGGDSVLAVRAVVRLRAALDRAGLGRPVLLPALLANPTVARLAAHLRRVPVGGPPAARPTAEARLSPAQQRLWSLQRADPLDPSCLISLLVRLDGPVHVDRLTAALRGVVAEHEALRTSFALVGDRPVQRVAAEAPLPLRRTDLDESADPDAEPARLALADAAEPVEPGSPPLLRCRLVARAGRVVALVVTAHRLVFDERSADLFVRDLARRYDRPDDHRSHPGPAVFAERQLDRLAGPGGREAVAAVADSVRGASDLLALPTDLPRGPRAARAGRHLAIDLDPAVAEAVRATAPAHRATPYMVGLAAFAVLLRRWCGQPDLLVGTTFAGRTDPESDGTIGCFATLLPVRLRPDPARPFTELLAQARRSALLVAAHQDVPPARSPGEARGGPLVRVSFGYRDAPQRVHRGGGVVFRAREVERDEVRLDLALCLVEGPHGLTARWAYRADLFHERTVRRLHERYAALLADATARPRTAVRDLADA
ncbi:condensation domain-containing protein, partial [Actinosynnema sp. NPDC059797]